MSQLKKKGLVVFGIVLSLTLLVSACAETVSQSAQEAQVIHPTVLVTRLVTQVVATPTIAPTPAPDQQVFVAASASSSDDWDPYSVAIYYPVQGCVASRLHIGDVAFVANGAGVIGIHQSKDIGYAPIWRHLDAGELIDIVDGPWCNRGGLVWKVDTSDGYIGFVPEGDGSTYWLLPMPSTTDRVLSKEEYKIRKLVLPGETLPLSNGKACR